MLFTPLGKLPGKKAGPGDKRGFDVKQCGIESAVAARSLRAIGECGNVVDSAARLAKGIVYHPHAAGIEQAGRAGRRVRGSRAAIVKWILG